MKSNMRRDVIVDVSVGWHERHTYKMESGEDDWRHIMVSGKDGISCSGEAKLAKWIFYNQPFRYEENVDIT